jgi:hypothetical protein
LLQKNAGKLDPRRRVNMAIDIVSVFSLSSWFRKSSQMHLVKLLRNEHIVGEILDKHSSHAYVKRHFLKTHNYSLVTVSNSVEAELNCM